MVFLLAIPPAEAGSTHMHMGTPCFRGRNGEQENHSHLFITVQPRPAYRVIEEGQTKRRLLHRLGFTVRDGERFTQRGRAFTFTL